MLIPRSYTEGPALGPKLTDEARAGARGVRARPRRATLPHNVRSGASAASDPPAKTAAALVIGDEILSGKVDEANVRVLARALRELGVELRRVVVVKDEIETIAREVQALAAAHDWVFTSGGIGPTHDDVTIEAVARAFDVPVVASLLMEKMLRDHYKERVTEGHLRMALIPNGASLEATETIRWPTVRFRNTWIMPGIPEVFRMKIPVIVQRLRTRRARPRRSCRSRSIRGWTKGT